MTSDPKILAIAFLGGIIPALLWLWFWLKEDEEKPEPKGLLTIVFIMGMLAVLCALPIQKLIQSYFAHKEWQLVGFAGVEEIMKYLAVLSILYKTHNADEPIDWPIYMMTAALGFAALENTFFLLKPLTLGETTVGLLTGELRFLGSTLLHAVASGILGIGIGISIHMQGFKKYWHIAIGFALSIALHSAFNFFIMKNNGSDFLRVFAFLWVVTIIVMLIFEKVRRMSGE